MALGSQRSATTWLANLLNTDSTLCIHDPLLEYTTTALDKSIIPGKRLGICCTAALLHPDWVNKPPAKKVLIYREPDEVNASLEAIGAPPVGVHQQFALLDGVKAPIFHWRHVFSTHGAEEICGLLDVPFCKYRHYELRKMNVQPDFARLPVDPEAVRKLAQRIREVL